ncbi:MAG: N-acetyltransferase [Bacteroidaceae bacterium]|nr:N-acetyltransferase [Bacteroidaceae bacterium]
MTMITIKKVETDKELTAFIDFYTHLYRNNPCFVPPLFSDERNCLRHDKNAAFEFCESQYYLAYNEDGKIVGRVAAIINHKANNRWKQKRVRFGWFDFIDDTEVSKKLLQTVEQFGRSKGMTEIVGPLGFTDLDREGMLIEGFDELSSIMTNYCAPYYKEHIYALEGYEAEVRYCENKMYIPNQIPAKYVQIAKVVETRYNLHAHKPTRWSLLHGEGRRIFEMVNETYKDIYGYNEISRRQIDQYISQYIPIVNPDFITIIRDHNTPEKKMIGFGLSLPSLGEAMRQNRNGRLLPFGWWKLAKTLFFSKESRVIDLVLVGVLPEYRSKGANALLFVDLIPQYIKYKCEYAQTMVQLEDNRHAISQWGPLNPIVHKRRECYVKKIGNSY